MSKKSNSPPILTWRTRLTEYPSFGLRNSCCLVFSEPQDIPRINPTLPWHFADLLFCRLNSGIPGPVRRTMCGRIRLADRGSVALGSLLRMTPSRLWAVQAGTTGKQ